MEKIITNEYVGEAGVKYIFEYHEVDSFDELPREEITQCYAVAYHDDKIVIVHHDKKDTWGLVGGTTEPGEALHETLIREIQEESNMKVLKHKPIGYQKCIDTRGIQAPYYQLRYMAIVEPYGEFESDLAGTVDRIAEIDVSEYKNYFDWGTIGEEIIKRAEILKKDL